MNKKLLTAILVSLSLVGVFLVSSVSAAAPSAAKITKPIPWVCITDDVSGLPSDLWTLDDSLQIETSSGQVILVAHFDKTEFPEEYRPDKATKITGFVTPTWAGPSTDDTMIILTPSGKVMLRAIYHP